MDFVDHGDPEVDERWRKLLGGDPVQRHASLAGEPIPRMMPDDEDDDPHFAPEDFVPMEYRNYGRDSLAVCEDMLSKADRDTIVRNALERHAVRPLRYDS
jgi:hypothetical protein